MTTCVFCGENLETGARRCSYCGRTPLPPKRFNIVLSLSLAGIVILAAVTYFALSQLIWLPVARSLFYSLADSLGIGYTLQELPSQSIINAPWLFGGAVLYLPFVTFLITRFGFKRSLVSAVMGPLPFAFMDAWGWVGDRGPTVLEFLPVLVVAALIGLGLHFLFLFAAARWPSRATFIQGWALQPAPRLEPDSKRKVASELVMPVPEPLMENRPPVMVKPVEAPILEVPPMPETVVAPAVLTENRPENTVPTPVLAVETEGVPELVPLPRVKESAPPRLVPLSTKDSAENQEERPTSGPPVWLMVVGLGLLIIVGIVLVGLALK